jgi:hypothetical protein
MRQPDGDEGPAEYLTSDTMKVTVMDTMNVDRLARSLAAGATRRRAIATLGALALGGAGFLGRRQSAAADIRRCINRCTEPCEDNDKYEGCAKRCRDWCERR